MTQTWKEFAKQLREDMRERRKAPRKMDKEAAEANRVMLDSVNPFAKRDA